MLHRAFGRCCVEIRAVVEHARRDSTEANVGPRVLRPFLAGALRETCVSFISVHDTLIRVYPEPRTPPRWPKIILKPSIPKPERLLHAAGECGELLRTEMGWEP